MEAGLCNVWSEAGEGIGKPVKPITYSYSNFINMLKQWKEIRVSFGSGTAIPGALALLKSTNEKESETGYWKLQSLVVNQSDLYEGAYYIIEPVIRLLQDALFVHSFYPLDLLYEIFCGFAPEDYLIDVENGKTLQLTMACREKILSFKNILENLKTTSKKNLDAKNNLLEVFNNPPEMFPAKKSATELLGQPGFPPSAAGL